jgi:hypothetical protein
MIEKVTQELFEESEKDPKSKMYILSTCSGCK